MGNRGTKPLTKEGNRGKPNTTQQVNFVPDITQEANRTQSTTERGEIETRHSTLGLPTLKLTKEGK